MKEEREEKLVYAEKSGHPSILRHLVWMFLGEFLACILYGVAKGGSGSFDAQMEGAPVFLALSLTVDLLLGAFFYHLNGRRKTEIAIYEQTVYFSAPKVPVLNEDSPAAPLPDGLSDPEGPPESVPAPEPAPAPAEDEATGNPFAESEEFRRENPYLRKKAQKSGSPAPKRKSRSGARFGGSPDKTGGVRIGKVTSDTPNSEVTCPVSDLRSASRKGKNVLLILQNGDRYLFVRMSGADRLVKIIEDKVEAVI